MQRYNVEFFLPLMYWLWRLPAVWSLQSADEVELSGTWKGHSKLSVLGTGFPLSPINWRMCSVETHWPRGAFLSASIKSFYFSGFFFLFLFPFNISDKKKKMIWSLRYNFFFFIYIYISLPNTDLFKGGFVNFQSAFSGSAAAWFQRGYFIWYLQPARCRTARASSAKLTLQTSLVVIFIFFSQPSPFSLTSGPLRLGVKKCNISYRLLVWEEFLCIGPDRKVLTHSEGRTQRRSGCAAALCDLKAICTGQDNFFFPLPVQNKWVWSLRTVDFFIKQTFWLVIVGIVRVMMFSFHWSFPANHDREPAGTMARATKKRKERKAMRTAAMPVSFIGHAFFYLSEVLWISGAGNVRRYFELFLS